MHPEKAEHKPDELAFKWLLIAGLPILANLWLLTFYLFCYRAKLELGYWPSSILDSVSRDLIVGLHGQIARAGFFALAFGAPFWFAAIAFHSIRTRSPRYVHWIVVLMLPILILWVDPGNLFDWFLD